MLMLKKSQEPQARRRRMGHPRAEEESRTPSAGTAHGAPRGKRQDTGHIRLYLRYWCDCYWALNSGLIVEMAAPGPICLACYQPSVYWICVHVV